MPYEWPPLTPGDSDEVASRVAAVLEDAWQRLADKQAAVTAAITARWRLPYVLATLEEFKAAINDFHSRVDNEARAFVGRQLPHLYQEGAVRAAEQVGERFVWTLAHSDALQSLASDSYGDFLRRSQEAGRMAEQWYRRARATARTEVPLLAAGNTTATQAAKGLADELVAQGLNHVVYRSGARVPVRAWAESAALAKSAVAYNAGTLNKTREAGVRMVEVFDGADCGWISHRDPDKATGTLRDVDEAAEWPISHPRCRRAFGPRPDVPSMR
ncbi:phage minor capsid protein [Streptomyces sp. NPDC057557]|uniref:phage minor capsid protein n=1 Tax=Streptomyces sp. NPDC057557 TaxID=3346167 RepID=UPI0036D0F907